jgi:hypothetical protein
MNNTERAERALNALLDENDDANDLDLERNIFICDDDNAADLDIPPSLIPIASAIIALHAMLSRDALTMRMLSYSLCPLHHIDYAICFDDDDDECRPIRMMHPDHDT